MVREVVTQHKRETMENVKTIKKITRIKMLSLSIGIIFINILTCPVCHGLPKGNPENKVIIADEQTEIINVTSSTNLPTDHRDGGLPLISDSVFSLIIMIYVLLAFFFVFFLFCWKRGPDRPFTNTKGTSHCLLQGDMPAQVVTPPTPQEEHHTSTC